MTPFQKFAQLVQKQFQHVCALNGAGPFTVLTDDLSVAYLAAFPEAGGKIDADLRISLSWFNGDDLDLHVLEHGSTGPYEIYYGNRGRQSPRGGTLDVDMNAGGATTREPVENVAYPKMPRDGTYSVFVNQFRRRESIDVGYAVEVECGGRLYSMSFGKVAEGKRLVCKLDVKNGAVTVTPADGMTESSRSVEKWGLKTESFQKVKFVTFSPNFFGGQAVGNKHTFFVLDGARNDEPARGIYNEFLHPRLEAHRKVFELLGEKTKCQPTEGQLSGIGFSSTKRDSVLVKVTSGKKQRLFKVQF